MTEQKRDVPVALAWRTLAVSVVAMIAAIGLGLLLIPQLSLRAAIRGGTITLGALVVSRLVTWLYLRSKASD